MHIRHCGTLYNDIVCEGEFTVARDRQLQMIMSCSWTQVHPSSVLTEDVCTLRNSSLMLQQPASGHPQMELVVATCKSCCIAYIWSTFSRLASEVRSTALFDNGNQYNYSTEMI